MEARGGAPCSDIQRYVVAPAGMDERPVRGRARLQAIFLLLADDMPEIGARLGYGSDTARTTPGRTARCSTKSPSA
ncbi:MAG: hypothetical protein MPJ05_02330 [Nitrosopumilus sp.]|nr:hypothetical protein [Nitrosopumilus sp.]